MSRPEPSPLARHWTLDPGVTFLNHGAFGACPREVLAWQAEIRARMERDPIDFFVRALEPLLDEARALLGTFLHAEPDDLAFVDNATAGVNTVLRSLVLQAGDELLTTDHAYNAGANALRAVAERAGARVVVAQVPFPLRGPTEVSDALLGAVTGRTRLVLLDHVTSATGVVFPVESLVPALQERGVDVLVDGAHAPGMLPVDLQALGAAYYTGNCHKWLCAPKGAAFLHVRRDRQARLRPLVVSHGANATRTDRSRFRLEFDWTGTRDPSAVLSVGRAIALVGSLVPGGWAEVRARNHALACHARALVCAAAGLTPPCPESMLGSLATVELPGPPDREPLAPLGLDPLQEALFDQHRIEVPVYGWPLPARRWIRVSPHLHNSEAQYVFLAGALRTLLRVG
ncbi:MAG TPA: aminotransferase class V-fold PLP-dependent enzyme [Myxococcaceae bacterium]|nr:aminotransferase class V-fold PLP-dependent enzyme [Myxococcaceae bacterium]